MRHPRNRWQASGCFDREKVQVWVRGFGSWNELDGDREAPGFDESQYGVIFGADYSFTESWFLGIAGGYFDFERRFRQLGRPPRRVDRL